MNNIIVESSTGTVWGNGVVLAKKWLPSVVDTSNTVSNTDIL